MLNSVLRRVFQAMMVVLAMTIIVFVALHVIGNPVDILLPADADQHDRQRLISELGLDQPLFRQYLLFLRGVLHGDAGTSYVFNLPALQVIWQRLPATLELAVCAMLLAVLIAIPLGLYAGLKPDAWLAKVIMAGSILGFSLPNFWVGLMLIMLFSVWLGWLPSGGQGETVQLFGASWSFLTLDGLQHLLMPALNLALFKTALLLRLTRAGVQEVLPQDYIRLAHAKGLPYRRIIAVHVLKNILIPLVMVIGMEFGSVIAFSVVTETIFAWPGMGKLIIDSINVLDRPVIVAYLMIIVLLFVGINLVVDIIYTLLDPRVRLNGQGKS
ncbi:MULTISPECIES: ABC transporter permease [unclassified Brenneria]|uniref:ABC transporter permease n=1 Tax=unclassified Brenneria TaxID=2634434 RepID=UPI0029C5E77E|nr:MULTISPECIES: ABC transporter permease [unclassified Brenneria]MDX5630613.1 ABC transporter permease [Brenneria sp. L3-3Z]MDX5697758.1 ABC transporter permease [Brenneria sp. L4-2C]